MAIRDIALRNWRWFITILYVMQWLQIYLSHKEYWITYDLFSDYIGQNGLPDMFEWDNLIYTIMGLLILWGVLLLLKHNLAPIVCFVPTTLLILTHDNPLIYGGTQYDKPEIRNAVTLTMVKLIIFCALTFTTWIEPKEDKDSETDKEKTN